MLLSLAPSALWANSLWYDASLEQYIQILVGRHRLDHAWFTPNIDESTQVQPMSSIHTLGYHMHSAHNRGRMQYGLEGGAHIGWDNRQYRVVLGGGRPSLTIRSDFRNGDFSLGLFTSFKPVQGLRFYTGAGPIIYWGRLPRFDTQVREQDYHSIGANGLVIDNQSHRYDIGLGLYARAGAEVIFPNGTSLGLVVRKMDASLTFSDYARVGLREPQYLFVVGYHYR